MALPPTASSTSINLARGSAYVVHSRLSCGSGASADRFCRTAARIASLLVAILMPANVVISLREMNLPRADLDVYSASSHTALEMTPAAAKVAHAAAPKRSAGCTPARAASCVTPLAQLFQPTDTTTVAAARPTRA